MSGSAPGPKPEGEGFNPLKVLKNKIGEMQQAAKVKQEAVIADTEAKIQAAKTAKADEEAKTSAAERQKQADDLQASRLKADRQRDARANIPTHLTGLGLADPNALLNADYKALVDSPAFGSERAINGNINAIADDLRALNRDPEEVKRELNEELARKRAKESADRTKAFYNGIKTDVENDNIDGVLNRLLVLPGTDLSNVEAQIPGLIAHIDKYIALPKEGKLNKTTDAAKKRLEEGLREKIQERKDAEAAAKSRGESKQRGAQPGDVLDLHEEVLSDVRKGELLRLVRAVPSGVTAFDGISAGEKGFVLGLTDKDIDYLRQLKQDAASGITRQNEEAINALDQIYRELRAKGELGWQKKVQEKREERKEEIGITRDFEHKPAFDPFPETTDDDIPIEDLMTKYGIDLKNPVDFPGQAQVIAGAAARGDISKKAARELLEKMVAKSGGAKIGEKSVAEMLEAQIKKVEAVVDKEKKVDDKIKFMQQENWKLYKDKLSKYLVHNPGGYNADEITREILEEVKAGRFPVDLQNVGREAIMASLPDRARDELVFALNRGAYKNAREAERNVDEMYQHGLLGADQAKGIKEAIRRAEKDMGDDIITKLNNNEVNSADAVRMAKGNETVEKTVREHIKGKLADIGSESEKAQGVLNEFVTQIRNKGARQLSAAEVGQMEGDLKRKMSRGDLTEAEGAYVLTELRKYTSFLSTESAKTFKMLENIDPTDPGKIQAAFDALDKRVDRMEITRATADRYKEILESGKKEYEIELRHKRNEERIAEIRLNKEKLKQGAVLAKRLGVILAFGAGGFALGYGGAALAYGGLAAGAGTIAGGSIGALLGVSMGGVTLHRYDEFAITVKDAIDQGGKQIEKVKRETQVMGIKFIGQFNDMLANLEYETGQKLSLAEIQKMFKDLYGSGDSAFETQVINFAPVPA